MGYVAGQIEASGLLEASGDTWVPLLRERLTPNFDRKKAEKLLKVAEGDDEAAADKALAELVTLGTGVRPLIEAAIKGSMDADVRLKLIVARGKIPAPEAEEEARRAQRLVAALRQVGTNPAEALLADMASGKCGDVWVKAAKAEAKR